MQRTKPKHEIFARLLQQPPIYSKLEVEPLLGSQKLKTVETAEGERQNLCSLRISQPLFRPPLWCLFPYFCGAFFRNTFWPLPYLECVQVRPKVDLNLRFSRWTQEMLDTGVNLDGGVEPRHLADNPPLTASQCDPALRCILTLTTASSPSLLSYCSYFQTTQTFIFRKHLGSERKHSITLSDTITAVQSLLFQCYAYI